MKIKEGDMVTSTDKPRAYRCKVHIIVGNYARCEMKKRDGTAYRYPWFITHISSWTKI